MDPFEPTETPTRPPTAWPSSPEPATPSAPSAPGTTTVEELGSERPKRRVRVPTFVIGLVAVALVGVLAGRGLLLGSGGASSPEEAVRQLGDTIAREDLVGALAILAPDEVRDAAELYSSAADKLKGLGVTPKEGTFGGIDLDVSGLELRTKELGPGVARVDVIGGRLGGRIDPSKLGPRVQDFMSRMDAECVFAGDDEQEDCDSDSKDMEPKSGSVDLDEVEDGPLYLVAVERDGGWYVSPLTTIAELIVESSESPEGDFDAIEDTPAASSPKAAVERLIKAANRQSTGDAFAALPSDEWAVLRIYREAIDEAMEGVLDEGAGEFSIDDWKLREESIDDDRAKVEIVEMSGRVSIDVVSEEDREAWEASQEAESEDLGIGESDDFDVEDIDIEDLEDLALDEADGPEGTPTEVTWSFKGGCLRVEIPDEPFDSCQPLPEDLGGSMLGGGPFWFTPAGLVESGSAMSEIGGTQLQHLYVIAVRDRDGWAISPIATIQSYLRAGLEMLDENMVTRLSGGALDTKPTAKLTADEPVEVKMNSGGFAVVTYDHDGAAPFGVQAEGGAVDYEYRGPGDDSGQWSSTFLSGDEGTYRFVITGRPASKVTVAAVSFAEAPTLGIGETLTVELEESDQPQVFRLTLAAGQALTVDGLDGPILGGWYQLIGPDGEEIYDGNTVVNDGDQPADGWLLLGGFEPTSVELRVVDEFATLHFEDGGDAVSLDGDDDQGDGMIGQFAIPAGQGASLTVTPTEPVLVEVALNCGDPTEKSELEWDLFDDPQSAAMEGQPVTVTVPAADGPQWCVAQVNLRPQRLNGVVQLQLAPA